MKAVRITTALNNVVSFWCNTDKCGQLMCVLTKS